MQTTATEVVEDGTRRDRRGRRMTPRARRAALVRAFQVSGLTQAAFARREGLNPKTLSHWVKPAERAGPATPAMRFAQLSVPSARPTVAATLEVALADGTIVRGSDATAMAALVGALRS